MISDRSVRSFTLGYYRSLGGQCQPLDEQGQSWEVRLRNQALSLNFDPEDPGAIAPGTPKWREIIEECVKQPTVTCRYLVVGPLNPKQMFEGVVPYRIGKTRLLKAERLWAMALTHRVIYDAPALSAKREELITGVYDLDGNYLEGLAESYETFQTLPIAPEIERAFDQEVIQKAALSKVDVHSEEEGLSIEEGLKPSLEAAIERLTAYYDQRKAAEPEEAELLDRMKANAIREEQDRHEVTVTTELAALGALCYDRVSYRVEILAPEGPVWSELHCVPVTGEVSYPPCPACGEEVDLPVFNRLGQFVCNQCQHVCHDCGKPLSKNETAIACIQCGELLCPDCVKTCSHCGMALCNDHALHCSDCGELICHHCAGECHTCGATICVSHSRSAEGHLFCQEHSVKCAGCGSEITHGVPCAVSGDLYCPLCMTECVVCGKAISKQNATRTIRGPVCEEHILTCDCCGERMLEGMENVCPNCGGKHCDNDMEICPRCGLPTCTSCLRENGCVACTEMEDIPASDERALQVKEWFPDLKPVRYRASENLTDILVEWTDRLGRWGLIVFSKHDRCFRSAYRYGAWSSFLQRLVQKHSA